MSEMENKMKLSNQAINMLNEVRAAGAKCLMVNTRDGDLRQAFGELKSADLVKCSVGIGNALRVSLSSKGKMYFFNKK